MLGLFNEHDVLDQLQETMISEYVAKSYHGSHERNYLQKNSALKWVILQLMVQNSLS